MKNLKFFIAVFLVGLTTSNALAQSKTKMVGGAEMYPSKKILWKTL